MPPFGLRPKGDKLLRTRIPLSQRVRRARSLCAWIRTPGARMRRCLKWRGNRVVRAEWSEMRLPLPASPIGSHTHHSHGMFCPSRSAPPYVLSYPPSARGGVPLCGMRSMNLKGE